MTPRYRKTKFHHAEISGTSDAVASPAFALCQAWSLRFFFNAVSTDDNPLLFRLAHYLQCHAINGNFRYAFMLINIFMISEREEILCSFISDMNR
jgi:hypothetical protein